MFTDALFTIAKIWKQPTCLVSGWIDKDVEDTYNEILFSWGLSGGSGVKNPPAMQETQVQFLGQENLLEDNKATHSRILAWRIPMDRGAWRAAVHRVAQSQTWLKRLSAHAHTHRPTETHTHTHTHTQFSHKKEGKLAICNNTDGLGGHCARWNKPDWEKLIAHGIMYM